MSIYAMDSEPKEMCRVVSKSWPVELVGSDAAT